MEVPLSYLVVKRGEHYSIIVDLLLSVFFIFNLYLNSKHEISIKGIKQQFEFSKNDGKYTKPKKILRLLVEALSILPVEVFLDLYPDSTLVITCDCCECCD
jgi:hypothetical protein